MTDSLPAHSPKYAAFDASSVDLVVEHPQLGTLPFTAHSDDLEPLGQSLYARAVAGEFGEVAPYDGPPPPDPMEVLADAVRSERNRRLLALDALLANPLRWAAFPATQQAELAVYRQALLDVPQQTGFPEEVEWPQMPDGLTGQAT